MAARSSLSHFRFSSLACDAHSDLHGTPHTSHFSGRPSELKELKATSE